MCMCQWCITGFITKTVNLYFCTAYNHYVFYGIKLKVAIELVVCMYILDMIECMEFLVNYTHINLLTLYINNNSFFWP